MRKGCRYASSISNNREKSMTCNIQELKKLFAGLSKRGKAITVFIFLIVLVAILELFTGCSSYSLGRTWSF